MQALHTSDYRGQVWPRKEDEDESYPLYVISSTSYLLLRSFAHLSSPLVMKVRSRAGSVRSGASTPGGGGYKNLSERDLQKADAALSHVNEKQVNGNH